MDQQNSYRSPDTDTSDTQDRRELVRKLGKFAVYAAPFTMLALKGNAQGAGGHGSGGLNSSSATPLSKAKR